MEKFSTLKREMGIESYKYAKMMELKGFYETQGYH